MIFASVDRFAPRFLAEEPFFIVDVSSSSSSGYSTFYDPAFDPIYPQFPPDLPSEVKSAPTTPQQHNTNPIIYASNNPSHVIHSQTQNQHPSPLFRLESADDDLGLTCVLGQVGPAATCPCATPRYRVVGASSDEDSELINANNDPIFGDFESKGQGSWNSSSQEQSVQFWADEETGDVFLSKGFKLQPRKHYFITLQVSGE